MSVFVGVSDQPHGDSFYYFQIGEGALLIRPTLMIEQLRIP
jgi:hypothetical protein